MNSACIQRQGEDLGCVVIIVENTDGLIMYAADTVPINDSSKLSVTLRDPPYTTTENMAALEKHDRYLDVEKGHSYIGTKRGDLLRCL